MLRLKLKRFTSVFQVMSLFQVHLLVAPKVLGAGIGINSFFVIIMKKILLIIGSLFLLFISCGKDYEVTADDSTSNDTIVSNPSSGGTEGIGERYYD